MRAGLVAVALLIGVVAVDLGAPVVVAGASVGSASCLSPTPHEFGDVAAASYYNTAVSWLVEAGITGGTAPGKYSPNQVVTRAQMAVFLWNAADRPEPVAPHEFWDVDNNSYYNTAVSWLVGAGITGGTAPGQYSPAQSVTRAQMAVFLWKAAGSPAPGVPHGFGDVASGSYYNTAVSWLVGAGITGGTAPGRYSPNQVVTRAQMAVFLYKSACGQPLTVATTSLPGASTGVGFSTSLSAGGGAAPYSWAKTAGSLPAGIAMSPSGVLSGTPTGTGTASFTVRVTDAAAATATKVLSLTVNAPSDWAQPRRDPERRGWAPTETSISPATAPGVHEEWNAAPANTAIAGGTLYRVGARDSDPTWRLMAGAVADGSIAWDVELDPTCNGSPLVTSTAVIVMCGGGHAVAYARTGSHQVLWDTANTDPGTSFQSGLIAGSTMVAWDGTTVLAYRLNDGQRLWQRLQPSGAGQVSEVAASGNTVVIAYADRLKAVSMSTGADVWNRPGVSTSGIVISDGWVYTSSGGVARFNLTTGAPGWVALAGTDIYRIVAADADTVYAWEATFDFGPPSPSVLRALKTSDGSERWSYDVPSRIGTVAITGDLVWVTSSESYNDGRSSDLIALSRATGAQLRKIHFNDNMYAGDLVTFGAGRVLLDQGGSAGEPIPHRLRVFGVAPPLPVIDTTVLPLARMGSAYSTDLTGSKGTAPFQWSLVSGTLPTGLALSTGGTISGTPTAIGDQRITVRVTDAKGRTADRPYTIAVAGGAPGDWTTTGRDATANRFDPGEVTVGLNSVSQIGYRWKTAPVAGDVNSDWARDPLVVGGRMYDVSSNDGELRAWDTAGNAANRAPVWHTAAVADPLAPNGTNYFAGAPTSSGGVLYLFDSTGRLTAVRQSDGVQLWRAPSIELRLLERSAPLVIGTRILVKDTWGDIFGFSTADGSPLWGGSPIHLEGDSEFVQEITSNGTLAFTKEGCDLWALNPINGTVVWRTEIVVGGSGNCLDNYYPSGNNTPVVSGGSVYVGSWAGVAVVDATSGAVRWRRGLPTADGSVVVGGVWVVNEVTNYSGLVGLDTATGDVLWAAPPGVVGGQLSAAGDLIVARTPYELTGYDRLTGDEVWTGGAFNNGYLSGAATIARGRLYVGEYVDGVRAYGPPS